MTEVFTRYGDGGPRPAHIPPKACTVRHPDAGGQCPREAIGEVWALPFCEAHGKEAEMAYRDEIAEDVYGRFEAYREAETHKLDTNYPLLAVLASADMPELTHVPTYEALMAEAFPPDELAANIDADTLRHDYNERGYDGPYDWWSESRLLAVRFMRQAQSVPIIKELELVRERATVQQLLASRHMDEVCGPPVGV